MPCRSPTTEFHHPLVNIKESNAKKGMTNYLSYALADILTWQGCVLFLPFYQKWADQETYPWFSSIGDLVNAFRSDVLNLKTLSLRTGPGLVDTLKVPWTYCMSPALVPKPLDWKNHIGMSSLLRAQGLLHKVLTDVVGFYYLDLATSYTPPDDLADFLAAGDPPIYIGFGSVVVDDAAAMTGMSRSVSSGTRLITNKETVFEATRRAGVRALVSAGWVSLPIGHSEYSQSDYLP